MSFSPSLTRHPVSQQTKPLGQIARTLPYWHLSATVYKHCLVCVSYCKLHKTPINISRKNAIFHLRYGRPPLTITMLPLLSPRSDPNNLKKQKRKQKIKNNARFATPSKTFLYHPCAPDGHTTRRARKCPRPHVSLPCYGKSAASQLPATPHHRDTIHPTPKGTFLVNFERSITRQTRQQQH